MNGFRLELLWLVVVIVIGVSFCTGGKALECVNSVIDGKIHANCEYK